MYTYIFTRYNYVLKCNEHMVMSCNAKLTTDEFTGYKEISGWILQIELD